tara:strand:+ start:3514 stop:4194 length:681 start_codon:yes stop_codon:yes gene_type:complete
MEKIDTSIDFEFHRKLNKDKSLDIKTKPVKENIKDIKESLSYKKKAKHIKMIQMYDNILNVFTSIKTPYQITLIGPPLCGKSTFLGYLKMHCISSKNEDFHTISRDDILLKVAETDNYTEAWEKADQNIVNEKLKEKFESLSNSDKNVVIDMTNMTSKGRKSNNDKFKNHYKVAVVLDWDKEILIKRNEDRNLKENKFIPINVIDSMIENYNEPNLSEGFDLIIKL